RSSTVAPALWVEAAVFSMPRWTLLNVLVALLMVPTSMISASIVIRNGPLSGNREASTTLKLVWSEAMFSAKVVIALFAAFSRGATSVHLVPVGVPSLWGVTRGRSHIPDARRRWGPGA